MGKGRVLVELHELTKRFRDKVAVDKISVRICRGEIYGLVGPNGAGKTTTIRMIVGLAKPTQGWVKVCGVRMDEEGHKAKKFIGYVPDRGLFYDKLTGREFLEFVGKLRGMDAEFLHERIEMLAERFDIAMELDKLIESFSHGMKQRLAVCAAMLADPPVLVLDEPLSGLDPISSRKLKDSLREHAEKGGAVLVSTHLLSLVDEICTKVGIIDEGHLILEDDPKRVVKALKARGLEEAFLEIIGGQR